MKILKWVIGVIVFLCIWFVTCFIAESIWPDVEHIAYLCLLGYWGGTIGSMALDAIVE